MGHPIGTFVLVLALSVAFTIGCKMPDPFTVMTFNIRYGSANDGENRWELRRDLLLETIQASEPDIVTVQEAEAEQVDWLDEQLEDFDYVGVGRDDGKLAGEFVLVMFNTKRFTLVNSGHFWLSETPDQPGSMGWDAACPRITQWAILSFNKSPLNRIRVISTHFDHRGRTARVESAKQLRQIIDAQGGKPVILAGDFNCPPDSEPYRILTADHGNLAELFDPMLTVGAQDKDLGTFHAFTGRTDRSPRIDWILRNRRLKANQAYVERTHQDDRYPSDHFPVVTVFELLPATRFGGM